MSKTTTKKKPKRKTTKKVVSSGKNPKGQFTKGHKKSGGRQQGTKNHDGLQVVLNMLKEFIADQKNLDKLKKDFQKKFNSNPSGFFYKMVMPLLPKNVDITSGGEDLIRMLSEKYMPKKPKRK